ncbi:MAG: leucine-rich repeat domain-containing protein, partial [Muribaculaceae bacterium]|nr:leucine-rich repeat domain-containing protein [Muribaculaceae bacterium]
VQGANENIVDAIPAVNNQVQMYNMNLHGITVEGEAEGEEGKELDLEGLATITGVESTALRGQDLTLSIVPTSSVYKVDLKVNGEQVATREAAVEYSFVAMKDMDFEINVYNPAVGTTKVINTDVNCLFNQLGENNVAETVKITGRAYSQDLLLALNKDWAVNTVKVLDLSELEIVAYGTKDLANELKHQLFKSPTGTPAVVEKVILPNSILRVWNETSETVFGNCKNIEEITLPEGVKSIPFTTGTSSMKRYTLGTNVFKGCDKLKVIRIVGAPQEYGGKLRVCYFCPDGYQWGASSYELGHEDPTKVTVIVPDEYLSLFKTVDKTAESGNPWPLYGYNILSSDPVYGVEFDPTRVRLADETMRSNELASFLGDNVPVQTISAEGKIFPIDNGAKATVYVDGEKVELAEDGSIPVT